jgi:hypothetical protein
LLITSRIRVGLQPSGSYIPSRHLPVSLCVKLRIINDACPNNAMAGSFIEDKTLGFFPGALDRKEASIFKQLVGGDPLWANVKGDGGRRGRQEGGGLGWRW